MRELKINANFTQQVFINPIDVVRELRVNEIGYFNWIIERDGKCFEVTELMGIEIETEITKEKYDFIKAIETIEQYLKK